MSAVAATTKPDERGDARTRVLEVAEKLFMERGYGAISLRDIADALGMRQASLYYHFPGGKEELYVAVAERAFAHHAAGIRTLVAESQPIEIQLQRIAGWFASHPRMCLMGMIHADLPALHGEQMRSVEQAAFAGVFQPLAAAFADASHRGELGPHDPHLLAGTFLALLDAITIGQQMRGAPPQAELADQVIGLFLNGARA